MEWTGPILGVKELSRDIAAGGVPLDTARTRVANFVRHGFLRVRTCGANTSPNGFTAYDSAVAIALSAVLDCGVSDHATMRAASAALYDWQPKAAERDAKLVLPGEDHLREHPIERAIHGIGPECWSLRIDFWRDLRTGERLVDADLFRASDGYVKSPDIGISATPRGAMVMVLDEVLHPMRLRVPPPGQHHFARSH